MRKKTYINYRPIVLIALTIMAAVLTVCGLSVKNYVLFAAGIAGAAALIIMAAVLFFDRRYLLILLIVTFFVVVLLTNRQINNWTGSVYAGEIVVFLTDDMTVEDNTVLAVGRDITVNGRAVKGRANIELTLDEQTMLGNISAGDKLIIYSGILSPVNLIRSERIDTRAYKTQIKYNIVIEETGVRRVRQDAKLFETARVGIRELLYRYSADGDAAEVSYAMLTGSADYINPDIRSGYSVSGLAHILSASGLHIGFVFALAGAVLNRFKGGRRIKVVGLGLAAFFYCALCNYSVSIVRASVMGVVAALGGALGRRSDMLNNLMLSVIAILVFRPLFLLDLSFLLSFSSVLGIALLYRPFVRALQKIKRLPNNIISALGVSLAANIGIFPVMIHYFNVFYLYGLAANLIILPVINGAFVALLALIIVSAVLPFVGGLTALPVWVIGKVNLFAVWVGGLPAAEILMFGVGGLAAVYYLYMAASSGLINLRLRYRRLSGLVMAAIIAVSAVSFNLPVVPYAKALTAVSSKGAAVTVVYTQEGQSVVIGALDKFNRYDLTDTLVMRRQRNIDALIITNPRLDRMEYADRLVRLFGIDNIYLVTEDYELADSYAAGIKGAKVGQVFGGIEYKIMGLKAEAYEYGGIILGLGVTAQDGKKIIYSVSGSENINKALAVMGGYADIVVSRNYISWLSGGMHIITGNEYDYSDKIVSLLERGNFTIKM